VKECVKECAKECAEGMREAQRELVRSMVDRGMPVADVARYTGLAVADVQTLLEDATT
jgi:hypothetical protein